MKLYVVIGIIAFLLTIVFALLPDYKTNTYFVSYYTTGISNGFFGSRIFITKTLDVATLNKMKGALEAETTNSTTVIISIQKLP